MTRFLHFFFHKKKEKQKREKRENKKCKKRKEENKNIKPGLKGRNYGSNEESPKIKNINFSLRI